MKKKIIHIVLMYTAFLSFHASALADSNYTDFARDAVCNMPKIIFVTQKASYTNAWIDHNNKLTVTTAAIAQFSRDELKAVIAHEIAHAVLLHAQKRKDLWSRASQAEFYRAIREQELEADALAAEIIVRTQGIEHYKDMQSVFVRLQQTAADNNIIKPNATHPTHAQRITALQHNRTKIIKRSAQKLKCPT